ncbi:MAG TPA: glycoside hydrolase family 172 protein [Chitinophagaceae bacterium]|nr:glycoside hydrolase family 172 protein [Chitinophagaceae bacterium]
MKYLLMILFCLLITIMSQAQTLYEMPVSPQSRLSSFENPNGVKGNGGKTNKTAKGNAFEFMEPGETKNLLDIKGEGTIQRIWLTIDHSPVKLRSLRLQFFWDGSNKPAVDVPLGDFFGYNLGKQTAFQSALFSSGEGRSYNCYIPMPFKKAAKVLLINEGSEKVKLYYDIDFLLHKLPLNTLYFHAYWNRQQSGQLGDDYVLLPKVEGKGRFLGISVGLNTDTSYSKSWWGEGEVKIYLDGDTKYPTINGTGAEDYLGSAWGLGTFTNWYQGCTIANDSTGQFNFYRWHIPDAIYFNKDIKVAIQQIGGWMKEDLKKLYQRGANFKAVTIDGPSGFVRLLDIEHPPLLTDAAFPDGWVNFYRIDDYSSVSYFYLDKPISSLPELPSLNVRIKGVK